MHNDVIQNNVFGKNPYDGSYLTNTVYALPNGNRFSVKLQRDPGRRNLVTRRDHTFNGSSIYWYSTGFDLLGRPTNAVDSISIARTFLYNRRNELAAAQIGTNSYGYAYDTIGNRMSDTFNGMSRNYAANCLNQYSAVNRTIDQSEQSNNFTYDADGNLVRDDRFAYSYDAENRMISARPITPVEGELAEVNAYDHKHRRVMKRIERFDGDGWQTTETHTFVYDGCNIILERIEFADGTTRTVECFWGNDLSGTEQGAGGVGGLVAVSVDGLFFIPCYDHNGNIVAYVSESGPLAAQYVYDPYGNVIEQQGTLADVFSFGFSTKYHDREVGLVGYQYRFLRPPLGRWLNRDTIEEFGGENLYSFVNNCPVGNFDVLGMMTIFAVNNAPRYSSASDFWFGVYAEFDKGEGNGNLVVRRNIEIELCPCLGGTKISKKSSVLATIHISPDLKSDQMFPLTIHGQRTSRTYVEIASLPRYGSNYKGTIKLSVTLGYTKTGITANKIGNTSLFGSQDPNHGLDNFEDDGHPISYQSSASYKATLTYNCGSDDPTISSSSRSGSWGESDNDRMKGEVTRTQDEIHNGNRSYPYD